MPAANKLERVRTASPAYGRMTQRLHWVGALLLIMMAVAGVVMTRLPAGLVQSQLYRLHVGLGLLALMVTALRLAWRFREPWPPAPPGLSRSRERAFKWNHVLLYVTVVVLLASGVGLLILSGLSIWPAEVSPELIQEVPPKKAHLVASRFFAALFLMHVGGVVHYQLKKGDTLSRIGVRGPKRSRTTRPRT